MAADKDCPKCGEPMELIADEPDVGIVGGWVCTNEKCEHTQDFEDEGDEPPMPFGSYE